MTEYIRTLPPLDISKDEIRRFSIADSLCSGVGGRNPSTGFRGLLVTLLLLANPLQTSAAADGALLYEIHCSACHQVQGGGIGLPLSKSKMDTVPDDYIKSTIRHGRIGRIMPAFPELSNTEVDTITEYIRSWSGVAAPVYPHSPVTGDPVRGESLYELHCSECHAYDGSGEGFGTGVTYSRKRAFAVMPPAISNPGFLASASDHMIKQVIMLGRPGTEMESFLEAGLKEQDINDLVSYLRSFEQDAGRKTGIADSTESLVPSLVFDSPYDYETTIANLKDALAGMNFRYFPDRYLEKGLIDETEINDRQTTIRFCNFRQLFNMMRIEPRLGVLLPCRISVVEQDDGSVQLIAMNMRLAAELFNNDQLLELGERFNQIQFEIIEDATL